LAQCIETWDAPEQGDDATEAKMEVREVSAESPSYVPWVGKRPGRTERDLEEGDRGGDGVGGRRDGEAGGVGLSYSDGKMEQANAAGMAASDALLLGRVTYEHLAAY